MTVAALGQCSFDFIGVVDSLPHPDSKKEVLAWHEQSGGPAATALVTLARLGLPCRFAGVTGDDDAGREIRESLIAEGIDISWLKTRQGARSQVAFIAVERPTAHRTIFWRRATGEPLRPEEVGDAFLDGCRFLILDGLMAEASIDLAERARQRRIPVMLDGGRQRPGMLELARLSDYVVVSEDFAHDLGWRLDPEVIVHEHARLGIKALTVTMGGRGSITAEEGRFFQIPAFSVKAVDTTGAGDVFHGAYVYGLLQGWDLKDTVRFATAVAAMKCTGIGGRQAIPTIDETMNFLAGQGIRIPSS